MRAGAGDRASVTRIAARRTASMRTPSCTSGFTLTTVKLRTWIAIAAFAALLAALPSSAGAASKPKHRLAAFGSCSRFVHYARRHALGELKTRGVPAPVAIPTPVRAPQPVNDGSQVVMPEAVAAPGAGQDFSNTNNQEAGVDEPDSVKTDGKTIFIAQNSRIYAVDARSDPPKLLGTLDLDPGYGQQL